MRHLLIFLCLLCGLAQAASCEPDAEYWSAVPAIQLPSLSPDGEFIASLRVHNSEARVEVQRLSTGQKFTAFRSTDTSVRQISWLSPERILLQLHAPGRLDSLLAVERSGFAPRRLARAPVAEIDRAGPRVVDLLSADPLHILISDDQRIPWQPDVYRVNIYTGEQMLIEANPGRTWTWLTDRRGQLRLRGDYQPTPDGIAYRWYWRSRPSAEWRLFYSSSLGAPGIEPIGFDTDNHHLLVLSDLESETRGLYRFDPVASKPGKAYYQHPAVSIDAFEFSGRTGQPASVLVHAGLPETTVLEAGWAKWLAAIRKDLPDGQLKVVSRSADESVVVIQQYSDRDPGRYWVHRPGTGELELLGELMPDFDADQARPSHPVALTARDGLGLNGYLTVPVKGAPHPLVVYVHGGPWQRDRWGFDPMTQMLADQGYAVLKLNFRGSTGFGRDFLMAGQHQWGRAMQDDLMDAVRWAQEKGHARGDVCIMGMSYGGYAALMGVLRDPDIFKCAVAFAPVTHLAGFIDHLRQRGDQKGYAEWRAMVGIPGRADHDLQQISPHAHAGDLERRVLVVHGIHDRVVPLVQSQTFVHRSDSRTLEWLKLENSDHGLYGATDRRLYFSEVSRFLSESLGEPGNGSQ